MHHNFNGFTIVRMYHIYSQIEEDTMCPVVSNFHCEDGKYLIKSILK